MLLFIKKSIGWINGLWLFLEFQVQIFILITGLLFILTSNRLLSSEILTHNLPCLCTNSKLVQNFNSLIDTKVKESPITTCEKEIWTFDTQFDKENATIQYGVYIDQEGKVYNVAYKLTATVALQDNGNDISLIYNLPVINYLSPLFPVKTKILSLVIPSQQNEFPSQFLIGIDVGFLELVTNLLSVHILLSFALSLLLFILLSLFLAKTRIGRPLDELIWGLKNLATGKFSTRINSQFEGKMGLAISTFNELQRRLQLYEIKNLEYLENEKTKLESLITTITDGVILLDTDLNIFLLNSTTIRIFNWKK